MKKTVLWLISVLGVLSVGVWYSSPDRQKSPEPPPKAAPPGPPPIRYPVEAGTAEEPLPALSESDSAARDALRTLVGKDREKFFKLDDIIHRIVATIDNLPRQDVSLRLVPVKRVPGLVVTTGTGENLAISTRNATRYRPYVRLAEAVPTETLVAVYKQFYPLFQEQYENLGYPEEYFNDRLVDVIDHLLEAPDVESPLRLTQPRVLYEFSDPKLKGLSAGQKILLRIGRENALRVKAKLREIRQAVIAKPPNG